MADGTLMSKYFVIISTLWDEQCQSNLNKKQELEKQGKEIPHHNSKDGDVPPASCHRKNAPP